MNQIDMNDSANELSTDLEEEDSHEPGGEVALKEQYDGAMDESSEDASSEDPYANVPLYIINGVGPC